MIARWVGAATCHESDELGGRAVRCRRGRHGCGQQPRSGGNSLGRRVEQVVAIEVQPLNVCVDCGLEARVDEILPVGPARDEQGREEA